MPEAKRSNKSATPGPKTDRLKLEGRWQDAVKKVSGEEEARYGPVGAGTTEFSSRHIPRLPAGSRDCVEYILPFP